MEIDNKTNDPIDYDQSGTGGDMMEACPNTGTVASGHREDIGPLCGDSPYSLKLKPASAPSWRNQIEDLEADSIIVVVSWR